MRGRCIGLAGLLAVAALAWPHSVRAQSAMPPLEPPAREQAPSSSPAPSPPAAPPAPPAPEPGLTEAQLVQQVQGELFRVACSNAEPTGQWGAETRAAVARFNEHGRWRFDTARPSPALLAALQRSDGRVCPPECGPGLEPLGRLCVTARPKPVPDAASPTVAPKPAPQRTKKAAPARPKAAKAKKSTRPRGEPERRRVAPRERPRRPPPNRRSEQEPATCYIDLGYGRRTPCDAGGR